MKGKEADGTSLLVEFDVPGLRDDNVIRSSESDGGDALTMFEITYVVFERTCRSMASCRSMA